jgi:hypothetical protein
MFEQEAERVRKRLKQLVATPQPYVSLRDILDNAQVHPAYRTYFRAEVDWWVHEERAIRSSNPRFETSHADCAAALRRVDELYVDHARFDHEELAAAIDAAVKTRLNLLCRPRTTLKWFIYRGEPTRTMQEILLRLGYLYDHRYLVDGIRQWAQSRGAEASSYELLSVVEFERIVEKIDNDYILDLSQRDFVALLDPLYDFFAEANPDLPPECVPTEAIVIYLDDKGAIPISQALERLLYREQLTHLTRTRLLAVIDDVLDGMDTSEAPHPQPADHGVAVFDVSDVSTNNAVPAPEHIGEPQGSDRSASDGVLAAVAEHTEGYVSEGTAGERIDATLPVQEVADRAGIQAGTVLAAIDGVGEALPVSDPLGPIPAVERMADILVAGPLASSEEEERRIVGQRRLERLASVLDDRLREKVIKKVFGKDELLYVRTIELVTASATWKDALGALDRFYAEHNVEPNSAVAMEFSLAIRQSFVA